MPAHDDMDRRTRALLEAPIARTLLRLAAPNMLVMVAQAAAGLVETYFIGKLGTDALAGVALVFPVFMLMQMMSAGAMGGGIASSIARALGGARRADADALALHAAAIALGFGAAFTLGVLGGGRWLYAAMGGSGPALDAALVYSNWIFAGAVLVWLFNSLAAVIRGSGNMALPAWVTCVGVAILIPVSPALIFGWGPFPALGIAGGAVALVSYYAAGSAALAAYLWSGRAVVRPALGGAGFRWPLFRDILRVGLVAALVTVATNLTIIVGTSIGAGRRERALRAAWIGAGIAFLLTEAIGLCAAAFPTAWLSLFDSNPQMLAAGSAYLRTVGPFYGMFGLALALYFASQGAGRLLWPLIGNLTRLAIAALAGALALGWSGELSHVFLAQSLALVAFGAINAAAVAGGSWFGPLTWRYSLKQQA